MKKEGLSVKEVELFKAVDRWATNEIERQGITLDGEAKRRILGEEIVKAIRFPIMSEKEFVSIIFDSAILTWKEVGDMMKHYNDVAMTSPLPFLQAARIGCGRNRCNRFNKFVPPQKQNKYWYYDRGLRDNVHFSVNTSIMLHGVQHFGSEGGEYTVFTEVIITTDDFSVVKRSGTYDSEKDETNNYYGFDVLFDRPVCLEANKQY